MPGDSALCEEHGWKEQLLVGGLKHPGEYLVLQAST